MGQHYNIVSPLNVPAFARNSMLVTARMCEALSADLLRHINTCYASFSDFLIYNHCYCTQLFF